MCETTIWEISSVFVNTSKEGRGIIDIGSEKGAWDNPSPARNATDTCRCQNLTLDAFLRMLHFGRVEALTIQDMLRKHLMATAPYVTFVAHIPPCNKCRKYPPSPPPRPRLTNETS